MFGVVVYKIDLHERLSMNLQKFWQSVSGKLGRKGEGLQTDNYYSKITRNVLSVVELVSERVFVSPRSCMS